jgi:hypothetical protein
VGLSPEIVTVVGADAILDAEGNTGTSNAGPQVRDLGVPAPPGSEATARMQGLPRNLGGLVVSGAKDRERPCEGKRARQGRRVVGAPQ